MGSPHDLLPLGWFCLFPKAPDRRRIARITHDQGRGVGVERVGAGLEVILRIGLLTAFDARNVCFGGVHPVREPLLGEPAIEAPLLEVGLAAFLWISNALRHGRERYIIRNLLSSPSNVTFA